jgi:hypothetical protein
MNSTQVSIPASCIVALMMLGVAGCATTPAREHPGYRERAQSRDFDDVRISAAALSAEESAAVYGAPLAKRGIQPVWVEVENKGSDAYWLLFPGLDPNFFPASEAAEAMALDSKSGKLADLERRFRGLSFRNPVPPGRTVSGFVLTNLHEGVKLLQIDLFSDETSRSVSFLALVPGLRADYEAARRRTQANEEVVEFTDDAALRAALEALPCCVTNKDGSKNGRPAQSRHHRRRE